MSRLLQLIAFAALLSGCGVLGRGRGKGPLPPPRVAVVIDSATAIGDRVSNDRTYGYSRGNPVRVGGDSVAGPLNERAFLDALAGPAGQPLTYTRKESCCPFATGRAQGGIGLLDVYEVRYQGRAKPLVIYMNMYDPGGVVEVPYGLTLRKPSSPEDGPADDTAEEAVEPEAVEPEEGQGAVSSEGPDITQAQNLQ